MTVALLSAEWNHELVSTPEQFFTGSPIGLALYTAVADAISSIGPAEVRVTKGSQRNNTLVRSL